MKPQAIRTEAEYDAAMKRIDEIFDAEPGTPESAELDALVTIVQAYEKEAFPSDSPDDSSTASQKH